MKIEKKQVCIISIIGIVIICVIYFLLGGMYKNIRFDSASKAMVYIINGEQGGNGSIYKMEKDRLIIVTTYHLLQDGETVNVYFPNQMYVEGSVLAVKEEHDIGFVQVDISQVSKETLQQIAAVQYDEDVYQDLQTGDRMEYRYLEWNGGHVSATSKKGSIGHMNWYIEAFDDYFIYNYCDVEPGMSGCAAVAEDGTYIGMMIGGVDNESGALSARTIERLYAETE